MKSPLLQALRGKFAIPHFNFYNLESFKAIMAASTELKATVIFAVSPSSLKYMGADFLSDFCSKHAYLHLDHGHTFLDCKLAISFGFKSVMIDGSSLPFEENVRLTKKVVDYAHKLDIFVEAELGALHSTDLTDPTAAKEFVKLTGCDSLAISIGTSHGAYKGNGNLHLDILQKVHALIPKTPLVLHGASQIPKKYAKILGLASTHGIPPAQIKKAISMGIAKVNVDSDARLAWTSTMKCLFSKKSYVFDPRKYLTVTSEEMVKLYKDEIKLIEF